MKPSSTEERNFRAIDYIIQQGKKRERTERELLVVLFISCLVVLVTFLISS